MEVLVNNDITKITYSAKLNCVAVNWNGYCCGDHYRQVLDDTLQIVALKKATKLLVNQSAKDIFYLDDTRWSLEDWYPRLINLLGDKGKLAVVFSKRHNTLGLREGNTGWRITNRFFTSIREAIYWLSQ
ncbi:MAG: hypothetical protein ACFB0B_16615 [Thermonemataceae bacterium]